MGAENYSNFYPSSPTKFEPPTYMFPQLPPMELPLWVQAALEVLDCEHADEETVRYANALVREFIEEQKAWTTKLINQGPPKP